MNNTKFQIENNTVILDYEDGLKLQQLCLDDDQAITRDFYDWLLSDHFKLFVNSGVMLIGVEKEKISVKFEQRSEDRIDFSLISYKTRETIANYYFLREDMLDKLLKPRITFKNTPKNLNKFINQMGSVVLPNNVKDKVNKITKQIVGLNKVYGYNNMLKKVRNEAYWVVIDCHILLSIQFLVALMYWNYRNDKVELKSFKEVKNDEEFIEIESTYSYSGYVDLSKNKVYKLIKKNIDDPTRDYERHIEAWRVRGHYRRTPNGLIWIEPHIKGSGEVENRVYGNKPESEVQIAVKKFKTTKKVKSSKGIGFISVIQRIISFFKWIKIRA